MNLKHLSLIFAALFICSGHVDAQNITTVAGNGLPAYSGDSIAATSTSINGPYSMVFGSDGSLFIADCWNYRIRKVSPTGIITTIAGTGTPGYSGDNIPAVTAQLNLPTGIAIDAIGNLYICDQLNNRVRKIDTAGIITTIAGNGSAGYGGDNGPGINAMLDLPTGLCVDTAGNVFIADQYNSLIRKIDTSGIITTYAGTPAGSGSSGDGGPATAAQLNLPCNVCFDHAYNLYITDYNNQSVRKVSPSGTITTIAGNGSGTYSGDGGPAISAGMAQPFGIAIDNTGNLFVSTFGDSRVRKINTSGTISTITGNGTGGYSGDGAAATAAEVYNPAGLAVDNSGNVYIADEGNNRIRKISGLDTKVSNIITPGIMLFPNPATDRLNVFMGTIRATDLSVKVIDVNGCIASNNFIGFTTEPVTLDIAQLSPGIYICQIAGNSNVWQYSFIKK